jgi:antitoxin (DNA-binding transcriptional repressor) of toxin-antitoxin stability system
MQTSVRYYITRADDQPVVRIIPVAKHEVEAREPNAVVTETNADETARLLRMPKIVRPALRHATRISSEKL